MAISATGSRVGRKTSCSEAPLSGVDATLAEVRFIDALEYQYMVVAEVATGAAVVALAQREDVKFVWNDNLNKLHTLEGRQVTGSATAARMAREIQQKDSETEAQQKNWRWLLAAAVGIFLLESWFAGRAGSQLQAEAPAQ